MCGMLNGKLEIYTTQVPQSHTPCEFQQHQGSVYAALRQLHINNLGSQFTQVHNTAVLESCPGANYVKPEERVFSNATNSQ